MTKTAFWSAQGPRPRRFLALWLPFLATDRLVRARGRAGAPDERPLVVVERMSGGLRLAHCDPRATALGLAAGLTLADARARAPALAVAEDDPEGDQRLLLRLARDCDRFSPAVALDPPHGLLLDITGCAHLFGGEAALREAACLRLTGAGLHVRAAIASGPHAARALARFSDVAVAPPGQDEALTRPLPIAALAAPPETLIALSRAGLKRLGDLADRPRAALTARFGAGLVSALERTLGREVAPLSPLRPVPDCAVERVFAEPLIDAAGAQAALAALLGAIAQHLQTRGQGGRRFEASFFRTDGGARRIAVSTGRPSRDAGALLGLFRERLAALADPLEAGFGFDAIRLAVPVLEPLGAAQRTLDGQTEEDEAGALLDRLAARLGAARVLAFAPVASALPERAARTAPAAEAGALRRRMEAQAGPPPAGPPERPVTLFDPPQPVAAIAEAPDGPPLRFRWRRVLYEVARAEGPERLAPEWWRAQGDGLTRDYYRVEDRAGRRFWLFRAGLYGRETGAPRWFLHGLFS